MNGRDISSISRKDEGTSRTKDGSCWPVCAASTESSSRKSDLGSASRLMLAKIIP